MGTILLSRIGGPLFFCTKRPASHLSLGCNSVQLYVDGEFVGGADIVEEMHTSGELKQMLTTKN